MISKVAYLMGHVMLNLYLIYIYIRIILHSNIFYFFLNMKFLLHLTISMINIFKLYKHFFILCYSIYENDLYI